MTTITAAFAEDILELITLDTPYVALFNGDPAGAGVELSGAGYERKDPNFGAIAAGEVSNSAEVRWTNLPADTITHIAFYNADTGGTLKISGPVSTVILTSGDEYYFATGNLKLTASGA